MIRNLLTVCVCTMFLFGCDHPQPSASQRTRVREQKAPESQEEIDFAKMILERRQYQFKVTRDPFEPLDYGMSPDDGPLESEKAPDPVTPKPKELDALLLGVVRTNKGFEALLQLEKERKTVRIGNEIKGYRVHTISFREIELVHIEQPEYRQIIKRKEDPAGKKVNQKQNDAFEGTFELWDPGQTRERSEDSWENDMPQQQLIGRFGDSKSTEEPVEQELDMPSY